VTDYAKLVAEINADPKGFVSGLRTADVELTKFSQKAIGNLGKVEKSTDAVGFGFKRLLPYLSVAAVAGYSNALLNMAGRLQDLSDRTGVAASTLSQFDYIAQQTGTSVEAFADAMRFMNRTFGEAVSGNESAAKAFNKLGISIESIKGLSPEVEFDRLASAIR